MAISQNAKKVATKTGVKGKVKKNRNVVSASVIAANIRDTQATVNRTAGTQHRQGSCSDPGCSNSRNSHADDSNGGSTKGNNNGSNGGSNDSSHGGNHGGSNNRNSSGGNNNSGNYDKTHGGSKNRRSNFGNDTGANINTNKMAKQLSTTAINIKRREDYANMDPASKDRERTRVKRSRAVKMARDSLPDTAWVELSRHAQVEVADAIAKEIRIKYAAATPGPSSRTAADYAVHKVFAEKSHLFFAKGKKGDKGDQVVADDPMDVDSDDGSEMDEDDWTPSELARGWQDIMSDMTIHQ